MKNRYEIATDDIASLIQTHLTLKDILVVLQNDNKPPQAQRLGHMIHAIDLMSLGWRSHLKVIGEKAILSRWDNVIDVNRRRTLSLRSLLEKTFTLHHHIRTITRIAWSRRLAPILNGQFEVVLVPAAQHDISIKFTQQSVLPVILAERKVKEKVYGQLLERMRGKATEEGISIGTGTVPQLSISNVNVHAECTLLAYHLQHPEIDAYHYFGGSKLSCHGCGTFFSSFNGLASSFGLSRFLTKGSHNKIYLRWPCPLLQSYEQRKQLRDPILDNQVKSKMVATLGAELDRYVNELCVSPEDTPDPSRIVQTPLVTHANLTLTGEQN